MVCVCMCVSLLVDTPFTKIHMQLLFLRRLQLVLRALNAWRSCCVACQTPP